MLHLSVTYGFPFSHSDATSFPAPTEALYVCEIVLHITPSLAYIV